LPSPLPKRLAVGVSGGADSLCLAFLLSRWGLNRGVKIFVLTVDHRLRPTSSEEAAYVAEITKAWGLFPVTLPLRNPPQRRLQETARKQRYETMALFCHDHGIEFLLLAHHQEDQLETFFMRLQEESGTWGLGGMLPLTSFLGIHLCRPLLSLPKKILQEILKTEGIEWREDTSNQNTRFLRVRMRQWMWKLSETEKDFWRREFLKFYHKKCADEKECIHLLSKVCTWTQEAQALVKLKYWLQTPPNLQEILIEKILRKVGGVSPHPLSKEAKKNLLNTLKSPFPKTTTLGGCVLRPQGDQVLIDREWQRILPFPLHDFHKSLLWDGRFYLRLSDTPPSPHKYLLIPQGKAPQTPVSSPASFPVFFCENSPFPPKNLSFESIRWL
jgi:tRNA(Ile)-lysidine synthase